MAKKDHHIRIRAEEVLHRALEESAARAHRNKQDQARYLLYVILGLDQGEDEAVKARAVKLNPAKPNAPRNRRPRSA
jgi:hypothetical protein